MIAWENTGTQFSTGGNWFGGTAPANNLTSDIAAFTAATPVATFNPTHTSNRSIRGIQFDSGTGTWTMTASGAGTRTLTIGASGIVSNAQTVQTFSGIRLALRLGANQAFTSNSTGALYFDASLAGLNLNSFALTLNGTSTSLSNEIADTITGTGSIIKNGTGFWYVSGSNTFAGKTSILDGVLAINSETSLGANPGTFTADQLLINGGTLQTRGSNVVIDDTRRGVTIGASGGTIETITDLTLATPNVVAGTGTLTKTGTGTLTLNAANTHTGNILVNAGTLVTSGGASIGNAATVTVAGGATWQTNSSETVGLIGGSGNIVFGSSNTLTVGTAANSTFSGVISDGAFTGALTKVGAGTLTLDGANTYTGLTTVTGGTLVAGSANALGNSAGNILVNAGATLALAGGVNVTRSGTLTLNGNGTSASTGALHAAGGTGTTSQWTGSVTVNSPSTITAADNLLIIGNGATGQFNTTTLTLNAGATFHTPSAPTVTPVYLPAPSYVLDPANIVIHSQITGSGGITKTGDGTLSIIRGTSVPNTFTGDTVITGGKLIVDGPSNQAHLSSTNIFVGNLGSTNDDTVVLQLGQATGSAPGNNLIGVYNAGTNASSSSLTIYEDGLFNMNRASNGFVNLTLHGGRVNGVSLNPLLTLSGGLFSRASAQTSIIENGNLGIGSSKLTMDVQAGTTPSGVDLLIGSRIQQGVGFLATPGAVALEKTGAGKAVLTGANTYGGITDVVAGVLNIQHATALGQNSVTLGSTDNGTVVRSGAQLQLQGGITVANETLTLNGDGGGTGALRNVGGNNRLDGIVYLDANARINADAGTTLTLANPNGVNATVLDGTGNPKKDLTVGGAGDTVIAGGVAGFIGNVVKDGTGTLTLAGNNSYTGATSVTAGAVKVTHNNGLAGTGVTVSPNAALQFARDGNSNNVTVVGVPATISGTGVSNGGAIQNLDGNNTYLGAVTLAANSRITANAGSSLTLSGNVTGAGFALNAGGAGNTTYSGVISGTGTALTKTDGGTVTLAGTAANTFTGAASIQDGTLVLAKTAGTNALGTTSVNIGDGVGSAASAVLRLDTANQIVDTAALVFASDGRLDLNNLSETVGSIAGSGNILIGTGQLVTGGSNASTTFGGTVTGTGLLAKEGSGTLTISSNLGYGGSVALNAGTLQFNANNALGGNLTVQAGTTLRLVDTNLSLNNLTFAGTGNVTIDFAGSASTLNVLGTLEIASGITITVRNWQDAADYWYAQNWLDAVYNLRGAAPMNRITFDNDGSDPTLWTASQTIWQSYDNQVTPVPEPSTYGALLLLSSGALLAWRRRRAARR